MVCAMVVALGLADSAGTQAPAPSVRGWAGQAGFRHVQTLPIDNDFWRFYRLDA